MSTFEIVRKDGSVSRMQLNAATDPQAEVDKWSDAADVVEIRAVDGFTARVPAPVVPFEPTSALDKERIRKMMADAEGSFGDANQIATPASENSSDVECTVAELAELKVNRAIATDCRKPNERAGEGTGMIVFKDSRGLWMTTAGTPVSA